VYEGLVDQVHQHQASEIDCRKVNILHNRQAIYLCPGVLFVVLVDLPYLGMRGHGCRANMS
jgi:hypothetical protein